MCAHVYVLCGMYEPQSSVCLSGSCLREVSMEAAVSAPIQAYLYTSAACSHISSKLGEYFLHSKLTGLPPSLLLPSLSLFSPLSLSLPLSSVLSLSLSLSLFPFSLSLSYTPPLSHPTPSTSLILQRIYKSVCFFTFWLHMRRYLGYTLFSGSGHKVLQIISKLQNLEGSWIIANPHYYILE